VIQVEIERKIIKGEDFEVPCVILKPAEYVGSAVVVHGYGGFKEETLGLAWRIAEQGFLTGAIDLRGHGEHPMNLDENLLLDLETSISYFKQFGKVTAVGHSLGGRLSLISSADYAIGISPAIVKEFSPQTQQLIKENRDYRVRRSDITVFQILKNMPLYDTKKNSLILYGERDVPEIISKCQELDSHGEQTVKIDEALHSDIFLYEPTFDVITRKLREWYG
jgi:dienelactone hydrolase